jgi:site-specific recombinase XerD
MHPPVLSTELFPRFQQEMRLRNYAPRTVETYVSCLRSYVAWLEGEAPRSVADEVPRSYLVSLVEAGASRSLVDQHVSTLKLLYIELYGWPEERLAVPRPRREKALPVVPTKSEVLRMAGALANEKHRLAILLAYGSGLRVSELVGLDVGDVDVDELLVRVRAGKGRKDRVTVLAASLVPDVISRIGGRSRFAPLFDSAGGGRWSVRSVQAVVADARIRSGVTSRVTPHSLRHAFATHLLEGGTSLRVIQQLLGHASIQTTTRYARMTHPARMKVTSPL